MATNSGYSGYRGYGSADAIARKRRLAEQLMQGMARPPRNVGEGLAALGNALTVRGINSRANEAEAANREDYDATLGEILPDWSSVPEFSPLNDGAPGGTFDRALQNRAERNATEGDPLRGQVLGALGDEQPSQAVVDALSPPSQAMPSLANLARLLSHPGANAAHKPILQAMLAQQMKSMFPADPMNPYQQGMLDLARERHQAKLDGTGGYGRPTTTVSNTTINKAESAFATETAKGQAKMFADMSKEGVGARADLAQIDELERLLASGVGGTADAWRVWAQNALGVNIAGGAAEAFTAMVNRLIPSMRPPGDARMTDADAKMFREALPQLVNSPEGNQLILDTMRGMAEFKRAQGEIAAKAAMGLITRKDAMEQLYALPDPLAKFRAARNGDGEESSDDLRRELENLGGLE